MLDKLKNFFNSMIKAENAIVKSVEDAVGDLSNYAVEATLKGISIDSLKHAMLYGVALSSGRSPIFIR